MLAIVGFIRYGIISEGYIANRHIKEIPPIRLFKTFNVNVRIGIQLPCNAPRNAVQLHTVQATTLHTFGQHTKEVADAAGWFQHISVSKAHLLQSAVHCLNHHRAGIVRVKGRSSRRRVFLRGQQSAQLHILLRPICILLVESLRDTAPAHIIRKNFLFFRGSLTVLRFDLFEQLNCRHVICKLGLGAAHAEGFVGNVVVFRKGLGRFGLLQLRFLRNNSRLRYGLVWCEGRLHCFCGLHLHSLLRHRLFRFRCFCIPSAFYKRCNSADNLFPT